jgi:hypothetical protein
MSSEKVNLAAPLSQQKRKIRIENDVAYVPLTKGYEAIIDAADIHLVEHWNWHAKVDGKLVYARQDAAVNGKKQRYSLHRAILSAPEGMDVDHVNGNGLDNRRSNLRLATRSENLRNRGRNRNNKSGYKGVSLFRQTGRWQARIMHNGRYHHLGFFADPKTAHDAYSEACLRYHGEFARAN